MQKYIPLLNWLPKYKKSNFSKDIIAGLPPVYGLYAALFPVLMYMFFGTSRQVAVGPVAMDSLLVAAGLGTLAITGIENYITMAIFLAFMVGSIQLILGLLKMGFLVNFLSKPVISGFTSAAALVIIFSQLKHLLGTSIDKSSKFYQLILNIIQKLGDTNLYDFAIGIIGILIILLFKKLDKRVPSILIVVILGVIGVYFLNLETYGVHILGNIPTGLPNFSIPAIRLFGDYINRKSIRRKGKRRNN